MAGINAVRRVMLLVLVTAIMGCAGRGVFVDPETGQKYRYEDIEAQVKSFDTSADFFLLRLTFTRTENYDPYDMNDRYRAKRNIATDALAEGKNERALVMARQVLLVNYIDITAHLVCAHAHEALGNADSSAFYNWTYESLIASILASGDGLSEETAFLVTSVAEEHDVLHALHLHPISQALLEGDDRHSYDRWKFKDPETDQDVVWFFDVTIPMTFLNKHLR